MEYVVWGAGRRGERVLQVLGEKSIIAYIDIDANKIGKKIHGKKIISFDQYLNTYPDVFLVISTRECQEITRFLKSNGINHYFIFADCPSELLWGQAEFLMKKLPLYKCKKEDCIGIYGISLFSIIIYDFLKQSGYEKIFLINNREDWWEKKLKQLGYNFFSEINKEENVNRILVVNSDFAAAISQYSNCKIEDFYDFSYQIHEYRNEALSKFKNIHYKKRCFIVATGPSLRLEDLECLRMHQEISISVNMVYKAFPLVKWRPDYYVMSDPYGVKFYEEEIKTLNLPNIFITDAYPEFWESNIAGNFYKFHNCTAHSENNLPKFSDNIAERIYGSGTVVYVCLQLAIYMGFKEIYIIGADCNYKTDVRDDKNHFIKKYYNNNDNQAVAFPLEESLKEYQVARHYAERHGVKIYNATRGGKLEVFERVDFDMLFKG